MIDASDIPSEYSQYQGYSIYGLDMVSKLVYIGNADVLLYHEAIHLQLQTHVS